MSNPLYKINDVVYLKESAALGFLEPMKISGIVSGATSKWLYIIEAKIKNPAPVAHFGDRIGHVADTNLYFTEDELIVLCDALTLAEANAKRQLLNIQLQKDALCPTTTTVSTSGTSGTA